MTAFEIHLNGRKKCTAGISQAGVVVSAITWARGGRGRKLFEDLEFRVSGLVSRTHTHVDWFHHRLAPGDEVKIKVVEKTKVDRPKKRRSESQAAREKREREDVERKAAKFGWKIKK